MFLRLFRIWWRLLEHLRRISYTCSLFLTQNLIISGMQIFQFCPRITVCIDGLKTFKAMFVWQSVGQTFLSCSIYWQSRFPFHYLWTTNIELNCKQKWCDLPQWKCSQFHGIQDKSARIQSRTTEIRQRKEILVWSWQAVFLRQINNLPVACGVFFLLMCILPHKWW